MENNIKNFDDLFREEFSDYSEAPPPAVWQALEKRLDGNKKRRVFPFRWYWFISILSFTALLGASIAWNNARTASTAVALELSTGGDAATLMPGANARAEEVSKPTSSTPIPGNSPEVRGGNETIQSSNATDDRSIEKEKLTSIEKQSKLKTEKKINTKNSSANRKGRKHTNRNAISNDNTDVAESRNAPATGTSIYSYDDFEEDGADKTKESTTNTLQGRTTEDYVVKKVRKHNMVVAVAVPVAESMPGRETNVNGNDQTGNSSASNEGIVSTNNKVDEITDQTENDAKVNGTSEVVAANNAKAAKQKSAKAKAKVVTSTALATKQDGPKASSSQSIDTKEVAVPAAKSTRVAASAIAAKKERSAQSAANAMADKKKTAKSAKGSTPQSQVVAAASSPSARDVNTAVAKGKKSQSAAKLLAVKENKKIKKNYTNHSNIVSSGKEKGGDNIAAKVALKTGVKGTVAVTNNNEVKAVPAKKNDVKTEPVAPASSTIASPTKTSPAAVTVAHQKAAGKADKQIAMANEVKHEKSESFNEPPKTAKVAMAKPVDKGIANGSDKVGATPAVKLAMADNKTVQKENSNKEDITKTVDKGVKAGADKKASSLGGVSVAAKAVNKNVTSEEIKAVAAVAADNAGSASGGQQNKGGSNTTANEKSLVGSAPVSKPAKMSVNPIAVKPSSVVPPIVLKTSPAPAGKGMPGADEEMRLSEIVPASAVPVAKAEEPKQPAKLAKNELADSVSTELPAKDSVADDSLSNVMKLVLGIKGGFESGLSTHAGNKILVSPYLQYKLSDKLSLMTQPSIKGSFMAKHTIGSAKSYYDINPGSGNYNLIDSSPVFILGSTDTLFLRNYHYSETHDSIVKTSSVGGVYLEIELPILLQYSITPKFSVYGGLNTVYSKQMRIKEHTETIREITASSSPSTLLPLHAPAELPASTGITYAGNPFSSYTGPEYPAKQGGLFRMGYMLGFSYEFKKRWMADVLVQQCVTKQNIQGGYNVNRALSAPYVRFTVGYRLSK
jgi:hypothetical protein